MNWGFVERQLGNARDKWEEMSYDRHTTCIHAAYVCFVLFTPYRLSNLSY